MEGSIPKSLSMCIYQYINTLHEVNSLWKAVNNQELDPWFCSDDGLICPHSYVI
jgi:hypothetical protein